MNKLIEKYNSLSKPLKASLWFTICSLLQKGIMFIVTPIYTRLLTTEQYGCYSVYQSWLNIITIFATFRLSAGVLNNAITNSNELGHPNKILSNFQSIELVLTLIVAVIVFTINYFFPNIFNMNNKVLTLLFINIIMLSAMGLFTTKERYKYNFKPVVFFTLIATILTAVFNVLFILFYDNKNEAIITGTVLAVTVSYIYLLIQNLYKGKSFFNKKIWKFAILFNLPLIPHYLSLIVLQSSDKIMIDKMLDKTSAALYSIPYSIAMLINVFSDAINASLIPWTYRTLKEKNYDAFYKKINIILLFFLIICLGLILFAPELIMIVGGNKYKDSILVIPPLVASAFFLFLYPLFGNIEFYHEKRLFTMISSIIAALLNLVLNYFAIPIFGYVSAAFTTLICYIVLAITHGIAYKLILKKNNIPNLYSIKMILLYSLIILIILGISYILYLNNIARYIIIGIMVLLVLILHKKIIKVIRIILEK